MFSKISFLVFLIVHIYGLSCYVYRSKVTILSGKLPIISFLLFRHWKCLIGTHLKYMGLNANFVRPVPQIEDLPLPPNPGPSLRLCIRQCPKSMSDGLVISLS